MAREVTPASGVGGDTDEAFAYDALNRLTQAQDDDSTVQMTYDSLSRVLTEVQGGNPLGTTGKTVSFTWDAASNRTKIDYPSGFDANESRDAPGRLTEFEDASSNTVAAFELYGAGLRKKKRTLANGTYTAVAYDGFRRPTAIAGEPVTAEGTVLSSSVPRRRAFARSTPGRCGSEVVRTVPGQGACFRCNRGVASAALCFGGPLRRDRNARHRCRSPRVSCAARPCVRSPGTVLTNSLTPPSGSRVRARPEGVTEFLRTVPYAMFECIAEENRSHHENLGIVNPPLACLSMCLMYEKRPYTLASYPAGNTCISRVTTSYAAVPVH